MWGYKFLCSRKLPDRKWMKWSDTCPYSIGHAKASGKLPFVADHLFNRYHRAPRAARKLYWRLHPRVA